MKNLKEIVIEYGIALVVACVAMYFIVNKGMSGTSTEVRQTNETVKNVEAKIDSITINQSTLQNEVRAIQENQLRFAEVISQNNKLIQQNNQELHNLKRAYNEKITRVDRYTYSQLDSFFAARYKYYSTKK